MKNGKPWVSAHSQAAKAALALSLPSSPARLLTRLCDGRPAQIVQQQARE